MPSSRPRSRASWSSVASGTRQLLLRLDTYSSLMASVHPQRAAAELTEPVPVCSLPLPYPVPYRFPHPDEADL